MEKITNMAWFTVFNSTRVLEPVRNCYLLFLFCLFLLMAGVYSFAMPAFQVPDEFDHWTSANVRVDRLFGETNHCNAVTMLPGSLGTGHLPFHPQRKVQTGRYETLQEQFESCSEQAKEVSYGSVLSYFQVLIARAQLRGEESNQKLAAVSYHLSRLLSIVFIALLLLRLIYLVLRSSRSEIFPAIGSLVVVAAFCSPMVLQQVVSVSSDVPVLVCGIWIFIVIAFMNNLSVFDYLIFGFSSYAAAVTKPTVMPLIALPLALVFVQFCAKCELKSFTDNKLKNMVQVLFACLFKDKRFLYLLFVTIVCSVFGVYNSIVVMSAAHQDIRVNDIDPDQQMSFILSNPLRAIEIFTTSVQKHLTAENHFYQALGWLDTRLSGKTIRNHQILMKFAVWIELLSLALLFFKSLQSRKNFGWRPSGEFNQKAFCLLLGIFFIWFFNEVSLIGNALALYIGWTPPGADAVRGLQGRYFIVNAFLLNAGLATFIAQFFKAPLPQSPTYGDSVVISQIAYFAKFAFVAFALYRAVKYASFLTIDLAARYW